MKKLLAVLIASALFVPAMAGSIFNNVETYGEVQTIGTYTDFNSSDRDTTTRVLFGLGMDLTEDVKAAVTFLNSSYWGDTTPNNNSIDNYLSRIIVAEAYVDVNNIFGAFEAKVGRQFYGDENSAIVYFGPTHYRGRIATTAGNNGIADSKSLDAAVVTYNSDNFVANIVYAKVAETFTGIDDDTTILGIDGKYYVNNNIALQAYIYDQRVGNDANFGNRASHYGVYGAKAAYADDAISASVEGAKNYNGPDYFHYNELGWMVKLDAAMDLSLEKMDITPRVSYVHAERDFQAMGNYRPGILFGGTTNMFVAGGDNNARILNAGIDFNFGSLEKFSFALDYYMIEAGDNSNPEWVGNEFNLMAKYNLNDYVEFHAGVAYMMNQSDTIFGADSDEPYGGQLGMIVRF